MEKEKVEVECIATKTGLPRLLIYRGS